MFGGMFEPMLVPLELLDGVVDMAEVADDGVIEVEGDEASDVGVLLVVEKTVVGVVVLTAAKGNYE